MTVRAKFSAHEHAGALPRVWLLAVAIAVAAVMLYAVASTATSLFDRDEPRFAQATVEMIQSGNWLYPTFDGELRPDKPILIYWLMSVPVRAFGTQAWAFRLPSAVGIGIAAFATFIAARRLTTDRAALLAMLLLITSPLTMMIGTAATADGWLLGMTTAAIASFLVASSAAHAGERIAGLVSLALFCGIAQLTKGPVALAVVGFAVIGVLVFWPRQFVQRRTVTLGAIAALLASVAIFLAWAVPANLATGGEFAARGLGKHVVSRMVEPMEGHGGDFLLTLPYYLPVLLAGFFPWVAFLPAALAMLFRKAEDGERRRLRGIVLAWSVPTFVMMSLVATKLPHYVLPIWPALAIAVAWAIAQQREIARGWHTVGVIVLGACALAGAAGFVAAPFLLDIDGLSLPSWSGAAVLLLMGAAGIAFLVRGRLIMCAAALIVGMLVLQQLVGHGVLSRFEPVKLAPRVASAIRERAPASSEVLSVRFGEPTLVFELWPQRVEMTGALEAIASWKVGSGPSVLIVPEKDFTETRALGTFGDRFELVASIDGFNYSTGDWLTLFVIGRDLPPRGSRMPRQQNAR